MAAKEPTQKAKLQLKALELALTTDVKDDYYLQPKLQKCLNMDDLAAEVAALSTRQEDPEDIARTGRDLMRRMMWYLSAGYSISTPLGYFRPTAQGVFMESELNEAIDRDRLTVLDALSMAGDLTIYGNRYKVLVLRQEGDKQRVYGINLTSGEHLYSSPAYYLQQNDVVYVEPNEVRSRQSTVNGNNVRSTSFWISLASLLTSIGILIFN